MRYLVHEPSVFLGTSVLEKILQLPENELSALLAPFRYLVIGRVRRPAVAHCLVTLCDFCADKGRESAEKSAKCV